MAKPTFAKMALKINTDVKTVKIGEQEIEVKQYLPVNDKLILISNVLNNSIDDANFSNPIKLDVFTNLEIIFTYTNLSFTDKQKEDLVKLYDTLESNDIFNQIIAVIPSEEYNSIIDGVQRCSDAVYTYRNSVLGLLDIITQDYDGLDLDAQKLQKEMNDPENLALLRQVLTKLG